MDFIEKDGVLSTRCDKWFDAGENMLQDDVAKEVCRLKRTHAPKGVDRK